MRSAIGALLLLGSSAAEIGGYWPPADTTALDCGMRRMVLARSAELQPWRGSHRDVFDALELHRLCGDAPPTAPQPRQLGRALGALSSSSSDGGANAAHAAAPRPGAPAEFHVSATSGSDSSTHAQAGSRAQPYATVRAALAAARHARGVAGDKAAAAAAASIVLHGGIHFLNATLRLGPADSGTTITAAPGAEAWLSGGASIPAGADWQPAPPESGAAPGTWSLHLPHLADVPGLFSQEGAAVAAAAGPASAAAGAGGAAAAHVRFTRARFPNGDAEADQWGYATAGRFNVSLPMGLAAEWHKPAPRGAVPDYTFVDLSVPGNPSGAVKDDSTMSEYNTWGSGMGGVCATVWDPAEPSYWCGNNSAGGWAEVDNAAAAAGQLNIPVGVTFYPGYTERYNCSFDDQREGCTTQALGPRMARWRNATGAIVHAWHSQSWAMHMFEVDSFDAANASLSFSRGGWQGGRNWCRCDQCTYAGKFCTQHRVPPPKEPDTRLIGGDFLIENLLDELDQAGEFYFNKSTRVLYFMPNTTATATATAGGAAAPAASPASMAFTVPVLKRLVEVAGTQQAPVTGVSIRGVGFRDAAATFMDPRWSAPSGGDWALHRGGALFIEGAEGLTVDGCHFRRLDGNAVFLSRYTRNVTVSRSEFEWIGDNAMATWGQTKDYDATGGDVPRFTRIVGNFVHELGLYEKQSSAWGQAKACQTTIEGNIFFNMPRAAINFNDGLGGGNAVRGNLIFNSCRESGDHGPINSWDRMPFLTHLLHGESAPPSFDNLPNVIEQNIIVANYGASQGVDNDDGSSFYSIRDNIFYGADGFKMDYGGHSSSFYSNLVMVIPYDGSNCINVGGFKEGIGDAFYNNTCISGISGLDMPSGCGSLTCSNASHKVPDMNTLGQVSSCNASFTLLHSNRYYSPHNNGSLKCSGKLTTIAEVQKEYQNEVGSSAEGLPTYQAALDWAAAFVKSWGAPPAVSASATASNLVAE